MIVTATTTLRGLAPGSYKVRPTDDLYAKGGVPGKVVLKTGKTTRFVVNYRLTHSCRPGPHRVLDYCDFSGRNLTGLDLTGSTIARAQFVGANLTRANLTGVHFWDTQLQRANLTGANLTRADLQYANVNGASFSGARVAGANARDFDGVPAHLPSGVRFVMRGSNVIGGYGGIMFGAGINMRGIELHHLNVPGIDLSGANIGLGPPDFRPLNESYANMAGANLSGANASRANFKGTDLSGANLRNADFGGTQLSGANFTNANLAGARFGDLRGTTLTGVTSGGTSAGDYFPPGWTLRSGYLIGPRANLTGANLEGADLTNVNLTGAKLQGATLSGVQSGNIIGTPETLPPGWLLKAGVLFGPNARVGWRNIPNMDLSGLDLSNLDLSGMDFGRADLTNTDFTGTTLTGADFTHSTVTGADFTGATLTGVHSEGTKGTPAALPVGWSKFDQSPQGGGVLVGPGADLTGADLGAADLRGRDLSHVNFTGAIVSFAHFQGANLTGANLYSTVVYRTDFSGATLTGVRSGAMIMAPIALPEDWVMNSGYLAGPGADFSHLSLSGVNLAGAHLSGANFTGTNLGDTNLTNADLNHAILAGASMSSAQLSGVSAVGVVGVPASLPAGWSLNNGSLIGP